VAQNSANPPAAATSTAAKLDVCQMYPLAIHTNVVFQNNIGKTLTAHFYLNSIALGDFGWLAWNGTLDGSQGAKYLKDEWTFPLAGC